ncbi:unnamed protein product, partial [Rotaria magnacalcarata]
MIQLDNYLQNVDGEKHKLRIQVKRLSQENTWLRNELGSTQKKLHESEQINACHSIEIENLKFLKDIQRYNNDNSTSQENHEHDLINDLFSSDDTDDEKDNQPNHSKNNIGSNDDLSMVKSQSTNNSTKDYEIPARLNTLHNLVLQYTSQGRYEVAVALCRQALDDLEKTLGHQHPDVATMLNILALVYRDQSEFKKAISLLYETLSIREDTLGSDHPAVAATLNNLAVLYSNLNKFKEAEPLCKRALDIREKCLDISHPDVAKQLMNVALICENQAKYNEAESYYKRAIAIYTKTFGHDDVNVAKTKNNLASSYFKQQKYLEAEQLYKDVLTCVHEKDFQSLFSPTSRRHNETQIVITTLKNLSLLYRRQGLYDAAEIIESCASRARQDSQAIIQALNMVQQVGMRLEKLEQSLGIPSPGSSRSSQLSLSDTSSNSQWENAGDYDEEDDNISIQSVPYSHSNTPRVEFHQSTNQLNRSQSDTVMNDTSPEGSWQTHKEEQVQLTFKHQTGYNDKETEMICKDLLENKPARLYECRDYDKKVSLLRMAISYNSPKVTVPVLLFLENTLSKPIFYELIKKHPSAIKNYLNTTKSRLDNDYYIAMLKQFGKNQDVGV